MSIRSSAEKVNGSSSNKSLYVYAFLRDVHRLIAMAYAETDPTQQKATVEEVITQRIVEEIIKLTEATDSPPWTRRYTATDNLPLSFPGKPGKQRPRIDIEILGLSGRPRPRFHFEAKRLGKGNAVGTYLGPKGLGCFVAGRYARNSEEAGMLGYVQASTCDSWAEKIRRSITKYPAKYAVVTGTDWETVQIAPECTDAYRTQHDRASAKRIVRVYHTLLLFHDG